RGPGLLRDRDTHSVGIGAIARAIVDQEPVAGHILLPDPDAVDALDAAFQAVPAAVLRIAGRPVRPVKARAGRAAAENLRLAARVTGGDAPAVLAHAVGELRRVIDRHLDGAAAPAPHLVPAHADGVRAQRPAPRLVLGTIGPPRSAAAEVQDEL